GQPPAGPFVSWPCRGWDPGWHRQSPSGKGMKGRRFAWPFAPLDRVAPHAPLAKLSGRHAEVLLETACQVTLVREAGGRGDHPDWRGGGEQQFSGALEPPFADVAMGRLPERAAEDSTEVMDAEPNDLRELFQAELVTEAVGDRIAKLRHLRPGEPASSR